MLPWFLILCGLAVVASGLVAGVFLTFSDFVMRSLDTARTESGIEAMQVINRNVYGSIFLVLLLGMAALSVFMVPYAYFRVAGPASDWIIAGGTAYVAGVFVVSLVFNIPMNRRLDGMVYSKAETGTYWTDSYVPRWTRWNHVRTISSTASTVCYLIAYTGLAHGTALAG